MTITDMFAIGGLGGLVDPLPPQKNIFSLRRRENNSYFQEKDLGADRSQWGRQENPQEQDPGQPPRQVRLPHPTHNKARRSSHG